MPIWCCSIRRRSPTLPRSSSRRRRQPASPRSSSTAARSGKKAAPPATAPAAHCGGSSLGRWAVPWAPEALPARITKSREEGMSISRRRFLGNAAAIAVATNSPWSRAFAQISAVPPPAAIPPIVFAHGNGDHAALWMTTLWRMESNGIEREHLHAINFTDPLARSDDAKEQPNRSSTEDQRNEFASAVAGLKQRTRAARVAAVGNSRGGYAIRNYVAAGGADVSHAVLCGVPN